MGMLIRRHRDRHEGQEVVQPKRRRNRKPAEQPAPEAPTEAPEDEQPEPEDNTPGE